MFHLITIIAIIWAVINNIKICTLSVFLERAWTIEIAHSFPGLNMPFSIMLVVYKFHLFCQWNEDRFYIIVICVIANFCIVVVECDPDSDHTILPVCSIWMSFVGAIS